MKKNNLIQDILDKSLLFRRKEAGVDTEGFWDELIANYKDDEEDILLSRKLNQNFSSIGDKEKSKKEANYLQDLLDKIDYSESSNVLFKNKKRVEKLFFRVAAVLIPFAIIISMLFFYNYRKDKTINYQVVSTQKGSKTKVVLEDGTVIWLNSESEIKYPTSFKNKDKRIVNLSGEAYFDVVRNEKKPFEVYVGDYKINVLGTSFNVKAYPKQGKIETTLEKGRINIEKIALDKASKNTEKITLVPNQTIVLYNENTAIKDTAVLQIDPNLNSYNDVKERGKIIENIDLSQYTSWKENRLVFKSKSLGELIPDLERWFNIEIVVEQDSLKEIVCTGRFHNETAEQVIHALCIASKINYEIDKNRVMLKSRK